MTHRSISLFFLFAFALFSCIGAEVKEEPQDQKVEAEIVLGNQQLPILLPLLEDKRVAVVGNHTSLIGTTHLVDSLLEIGVVIKKVFSPEHGFRGNADAGEKVLSQIDERTKLPIISLYGSNKKPKAEQLEDVDVILFDIQDVGARFYTYISTLHYVMEAAAEKGIPLIILDRPNPNGHYVDGPVLNLKHKSFVGMHKIPVVHGMTIGEYAQMINGEKWLKNEIECQLSVIRMKNYDHTTSYNLNKRPSPNLPNMKAVYLYPSLCFFEGTAISVGRGTDKPFQQIGHPSMPNYTYSFTPKSNFGAKSPKLNEKLCKGIDLSTISNDELREREQINLSYIIQFYKEFPDKEKFFTNFFSLLAGENNLESQIKAGRSEEEIRSSWQSNLTAFKAIRKKYLIYKDFE